MKNVSGSVLVYANSSSRQRTRLLPSQTRILVGRVLVANILIIGTAALLTKITKYGIRLSQEIVSRFRWWFQCIFLPRRTAKL